jgi:acetyltransferase-like isoleucine patch superfamily enzyme
MKAIVSPHTRIRHPEYFEVGEDSIVDDFSYFSTRVKIGRCSHIGPGCCIAGGVDFQFVLGDYSGIVSGVKIWCRSNQFIHDLITIMPPEAGHIETREIKGDVTFDRFTGVGANSVVMPDNHIPEGVAIGALSFVPPRFHFKAWSVYAGNPVRYLMPRDRISVLEQVQQIERVIGRSSKI